ncbi:MAG: hypothetical protein PHU66_01730 [Bacteroidaceae bacterium]|nr:hypothetical protein [Bacteroidaceae bacterium]
MEKSIEDFNSIQFIDRDPDNINNKRRQSLIEKISQGTFEYDPYYNSITQNKPDYPCWNVIYQILSSIKDVRFYLLFRVTPELFCQINYDYDRIKDAKKRGVYFTEASYNVSDGLIHLHECVQQNYGDEDGYGVEPDNYANGAIDKNGVFVKPLIVFDPDLF